jgi:hypothetical protein
MNRTEPELPSVATPLAHEVAVLVAADTSTPEPTPDGIRGYVSAPPRRGCRRTRAQLNRMPSEVPYEAATKWGSATERIDPRRQLWPMTPPRDLAEAGRDLDDRRRNEGLASER